jgi:hypothetical protein
LRFRCESFGGGEGEERKKGSNQPSKQKANLANNEGEGSSTPYVWVLQSGETAQPHFYIVHCESQA